MTAKRKAVFLDVATLGPGIDTSKLDELVDVSYHPYSAPDEVAQRIADAAIVLVNKAPIDADAIARAARLELIVVSATGTDNVAMDAARAAGVGVANIRDYCTASLAQHAFALILALTQHVGRYHELVRSGAWQKSKSFALFD